MRKKKKKEKSESRTLKRSEVALEKKFVSEFKFKRLNTPGGF